MLNRNQVLIFAIVYFVAYYGVTSTSNSSILVLHYHGTKNINGQDVFVHFDRNFFKKFLHCLCNATVHSCSAKAKHTNGTDWSVNKTESSERTPPGNRSNLKCDVHSTSTEVTLACAKETDGVGFERRRILKITAISKFKENLQVRCPTPVLTAWNHDMNITSFDRTRLRVSWRKNQKKIFDEAKGSEDDAGLLEKTHPDNSANEKYGEDLKIAGNANENEDPLYNDEISAPALNNKTISSPHDFSLKPKLQTNSDSNRREIDSGSTRYHLSLSTHLISGYIDSTPGVSLEKPSTTSTTPTYGTSLFKLDSAMMDSDVIGWQPRADTSTDEPTVTLTVIVVVCTVVMVVFVTTIVAVAVKRKKRALRNSRRYSLPRAMSVDENCRKHSDVRVTVMVSTHQ